VNAPVLSIVVTGRNDQYGGDFNERFFTALRFNCEQLTIRGIVFEVILVEWNPVPGKPYLSELLSREFATLPGGWLRRYVVAPQYHAALTQNPQLGYLEYLAKNVGIRRASGPFVLVTNTDVLLGRRVADALAAALQAGTIFRAPRYDIKLGIDQSHLTLDALEDLANHVKRPVLKPPLFNGASGDFVLADRETWHQLRGYNEVYRAARVAIDLNFLVKAHGAGYAIADIGGPVYHINHVGSLRMSKALYRDTPTDTPWGNMRWHSRHVVYQNPDGWGLHNAPVTSRPDGSVFLEFAWHAVPPLIELRRVVLPARQGVEESVAS
jgi:hypothetical protein